VNLKPSEDAVMIGEAANRFLQDQVAATATGRIAANDPAIWAAMAEMGWLALALPEERGGMSASPELLAVIAEALGRAGVCQPFAAYVGLAQQALILAGSDLAMTIADGNRKVAFVHSSDLRAERADGGYRIDGAAALVAGGAGANSFLIAAEFGGSLALFVVDGMAEGLVRQAVETVDGSDMADIACAAVLVGEPLLAGPALIEDLARIDDLAATLLCAEGVGAMDSLLRATAEYTAMRQQFGKPLRSFQVVEHALAEMRVAVAEARAALGAAVFRLSGEADQRGRSVSAAVVKIAVQGRKVAHQAIQFHGAMGVTEELTIGLFAKRLLGIACTLGTEAEALDRYAGLLIEGTCWSYLAKGAAETDAFRQEVSDWLDAELPEPIAEGYRRTTMVYAEAELAQPWHRILAKRGWSAPNWPAEFGGTGWSPEQRYVWAHESFSRFAPFTSPLALPLVGPVLFHYGTPEQQARYLPPIVSGEELWCQGFSEPGAGSDLVALSTRAVRDGDDYVVNGTKIWTTQGHETQMMAALVRTGGSRKEGISFLLIDLRSPGVQIRPIDTIGGDHELNQIFFDDVRVPAANLVGAEGQGWEIARFLLEYERGGDIMSAGQRALLRDIHAAAEKRGALGEDYRRAVARVAIDIDTLEAMELLVLLGGSDDPAIPSILKLRASETQQAVTELGVSVLGRDAIRWTSRRPLHAEPMVAVEDCFVSRYLNSRANTIFGGAREIQKTLIARTVS